MSVIKEIALSLTEWYAVSIAVVAASILVYSISILISSSYALRLQAQIAKRLVYPLLIKRRYYQSVTRLQGIFIGSYMIANGFCMGHGIKTKYDLLLRTGTMATINMIPLFLGGRTSVLANAVGISFHSYWLAHHWIGRVVLLQSIIHASLALARKRTPWTFDSSQISTLVATSALALLLLLHLFFIRRLIYEFFLLSHFILALVFASALLKHVFLVGAGEWIYLVVSLGVWTVNNILRLYILIYRSYGRRRLAVGELDAPSHPPRQAEIKRYFGASRNVVSAVRVTLYLHRPMEMLPGKYAYLFFSDMGIRRGLQSHPYIITWWDDSKGAMKLSFLIEPHSGISADLISRKWISKVIIDGPYGKDLHLEEYENAILIAEGIGIAGIMPYIRSLTYRRLSQDKDNEAYRLGLLTRKLNLIWVLEENTQQNWVKDWIRDLVEKDSKQLILTLTFFYPQKKEEDSPVPDDDHAWRFLYDIGLEKYNSIIKELIIGQVQRSPGRTKVVVCGKGDFSKNIRDSVIEILDTYKEVEFVETEFRPQKVRNVMHQPPMKSINLDSITRFSRIARSRRPQVLDQNADVQKLVRRPPSSMSTLSTLSTFDKNSAVDEKGFSKKEVAREIV